MRRAEQREQTRHALVRESRRLFASLGYGSVGLAQIVAAAGVTKGALYHHFSGKRELFEAVFERVKRELSTQIATALQTFRRDPTTARRLLGIEAPARRASVAPVASPRSETSV